MNTQDKLKVLQDVEKAEQAFQRKKGIPSQDVTGQKLSTFWYYKQLESFAKKEKEKALKYVTDDELVQAKLENLVNHTETLNEGQTSIVAEGGTLNLVCKTKRGASRFDVAKLTTALLTEHRMSAKKVEALIESCYKADRPSKSFDVEEKADV